MTKEALLREYPSVSFCVCILLLLAFTAFYQAGLFADNTVSLPPESVNDSTFPRSAAFSARLDERMRELRSSEGAPLPEDEGDPDAVYGVRPALKIVGVAMAGKKRCAIVLLEGERQSRIVRQGQSVAGIIFNEITQAGASCQWKKMQFFVPLE